MRRVSAMILHDLIDAKLCALKTYMHEAAAKIDVSVCRYWATYGHFETKTVTERIGEEVHSSVYDSMYVFPGRRLLRARMRTDGKDTSDCTKHYYKSRPHMTSSISLQCPCEHPKIIRFTLLKEIDSIAMAISTVIAFLNFPPRTEWYDNACNMYDSALLRATFLLRYYALIVDRFHFKGHTCSNQYNTARYKSLTRQRSTAAEVMNAVVEKSANFIRYLKGTNVKPYLKILFAVHNFKSMLKDD